MTTKNNDEAQLISKTVDTSLDTPAMHQALRIALYDEYHARATYAKVIEKFGNVPPFSNIVNAEINHINALLGLFAKYGVEPVIDDWADKITVADTIEANCAVGVQAEIENIAMYDVLIPHATNADVLDVFYRLQAASYNNHLPAFRACAAKSAAFDPIKDILAQNPNLSSMMGVFDKMGTEFLVGAAAGAVIAGLFADKIFDQEKGE